MKKLILYLVLTIAIGAVVFYFVATIALKVGRLLWPEQPEIVVEEVVISQGETVQVPPPPEPVKNIASRHMTVSTEVRKELLSKLSLPVPENTPAIQPDQAIVRRETDSKGNTTLTILTPVTPVLDTSHVASEASSASVDAEESGATESTPGTDQLDPGQDWYVVETIITIARQRSRLKPIVVASSDLQLEPGLGYEILCLEQKPP